VKKNSEWRPGIFEKRIKGGPFIGGEKKKKEAKAPPPALSALV